MTVDLVNLGSLLSISLGLFVTVATMSLQGYHRRNAMRERDHADELTVLVDHWRAMAADMEERRRHLAAVPPPLFDDPALQAVADSARAEQDAAADAAAEQQAREIQAALLAAHARATGGAGLHRLVDAMRDKRIAEHRRMLARRVAAARRDLRWADDALADALTLWHEAGRSRRHAATATKVSAAIGAVGSVVLAITTTLALSLAIALIFGVLTGALVVVTAGRLTETRHRAAAVSRAIDRRDGKIPAVPAAEAALIAAGGNPDTDPDARDTGAPEHDPNYDPEVHDLPRI